MKHPAMVLRLIAACAPAFAAVLFWNSAAVATPEMGKKERQACTVCHTGKGLYSLNEVGKYYKQHKTLPPEIKSPPKPEKKS